MAGLSDCIPFSHFSDYLGEDVDGLNGSTVRAIVTFHDAISTMGRQYQYLQLEVDSTVDWPIGTVVTVRDCDWRVSQRLKSTYTGSVKYTCGNDY